MYVCVCVTQSSGMKINQGLRHTNEKHEYVRKYLDSRQQVVRVNEEDPEQPVVLPQKSMHVRLLDCRPHEADHELQCDCRLGEW